MQINRSDIRIKADVKKVIVNYLDLGLPGQSKRVGLMVNRVLALPEEEVSRLYEEVLREFRNRHLDLTWFFNAHYQKSVR